MLKWLKDLNVEIILQVNIPFFQTVAVPGSIAYVLQLLGVISRSTLEAFGLANQAAPGSNTGTPEIFHIK